MNPGQAPGAADFALPAQLTVAQAAEVAQQALRELSARAAPWRIDAGELQQFDSACLALLLELRRHAGERGIELLRVPVRLRTLAQAYGVEFVIDPAATDTADTPA